jgi:hypothetical protein
MIGGSRPIRKGLPRFLASQTFFGVKRDRKSTFNCGAIKLAPSKKGGAVWRILLRRCTRGNPETEVPCRFFRNFDLSRRLPRRRNQSGLSRVSQQRPKSGRYIGVISGRMHNFQRCGRHALLSLSLTKIGYTGLALSSRSQLSRRTNKTHGRIAFQSKLRGTG